ncbi:Hsp20/alpha crystallin family protein [Psychroserpens mesophilus]|uniref:Hsp20/alpha crystallin family protein n=1 Tax=Psychroserpens mesophilus TaxID=325473 RepID=UPI003F49AFC2
MSLIKFNNRNRLFPSWNNESLKSFLSTDDFFNNDFFEEDSLMPAMNIKEHDQDFEIEFAAPGFSKKDFEVTINDNILNVCGEKKQEKESKNDDYTRKEFSYNSFKRSLNLPKSVNIDQDIKATYKNGILKLNLQKKEGKKEVPKKVIEVL